MEHNVWKVRNVSTWRTDPRVIDIDQQHYQHPCRWMAVIWRSGASKNLSYCPLKRSHPLLRSAAAWEKQTEKKDFFTQSHCDRGCDRQWVRCGWVMKGSVGSQRMGFFGGLGSFNHSMIDCDPACQRAGLGGVINSTFSPLFTLPLLNLRGDKSRNRFRSLFLTNIFSCFMS